MDEKTLKSTIAKNIAAYRKACGMTQAELAAALNYSDKSVSKWERAEGLPDIYVLTQIAERFGITLNDLVAEHGAEEIAEPEPEEKKRGLFAYIHNRVIVTILSIGLVWLAATVVFFFLSLFLPDAERLWMVFIYALPVSFIVPIVFTGLWTSHLFQLFSVSGLIWTLSLAVVMSFPRQDMSFLYVVAAVLQVLALLWYVMKIWNRKIFRQEDAEKEIKD